MAARNRCNMAEKEERPYFNSSISELERLFEQLKTNPDSLKVLDYELKFRTRNRAAKLRSRIAEVVAAVSFKPLDAVGTDGATRSSDQRHQSLRSPENQARELL